MNKPLIPPHIAWPAFIILLFAGGILGTFVMMWLAQRDGGAQVIDDYYRKATRWDQSRAEQAAGDALQWTVSASVQPPAPGQERPTLSMTFSDSTGVPISGLTGILRLFRPQFAAALYETSLEEDAQNPGTYRHPVPIDRPGLWDIQIEATRGAERFLTTIRTEVR